MKVSVSSFFYNLTYYFQLLIRTTWLISAPNINLTKFGMILDGTIWTPARTELFLPWKRMINTVLCVVYLVLYVNSFIEK